MSDKTPEQLATECEGIELHEDSVVSFERELQEAYLELADCKQSVRRDRIDLCRAWAQNFRLGIAQQLSGFVRGIPLWPLAVLYILASAVSLLLLHMGLHAIPILPAFIATIATAAASALSIVVLILGGVLVRDALKDAKSAAKYADMAMTRLKKARLMYADSSGRLRNTKKIVASLTSEGKTQTLADHTSGCSSAAKSLNIQKLFSHVFWRRLSGEKWERFLADIFKAHGYNVELTKVSGDQGVDLIVEYSSVRLAVQAKGYSGSVGNAAVQEAVAGRIFYNCTHCAVITNSSFTKAARELASRTSCVLIGELEIDELITNGLKRYF